MNSIIPFKKNIIFKTQISEITDISLTHDYKILESVIEGELYLSGTYKMSPSSLSSEDFYYNIPFSIALSERIDKDTINLKIDSFEYKIDGDTLSLSVKLDMDADELKEERSIIDDIKEKLDIDEELPKEDNADIKEIKEEVSESTIKGLLSSIDESNSYITYKVHIFRDGDSIESISKKYNVSIEDIKEYNDIDMINIGDKILVPYNYNE